jgi:hypothetical protein
LEEEIEEIENNAPENNKTDDKKNSENVDDNIDNAIIEVILLKMLLLIKITIIKLMKIILKRNVFCVINYLIKTIPYYGWRAKNAIIGIAVHVKNTPY